MGKLYTQLFNESQFAAAIATENARESEEEDDTPASDTVRARAGRDGRPRDARISRDFARFA